MDTIRNYGVVTSAYWGLTLTDGALRMLVLLHFHQLGFSPFEIAFLFLLYELFGVITNLMGGWIATRLGLRFTLFSGLFLQILSLLMLFALDPAWARDTSIMYVLVSQGLSGIAKDLTKMSAKSAIKSLVSEDANVALFRWVALLTGSKNTLKGVGFFMGGALLAAVGFENALLIMAAALSAVFVMLLLLLRGQLEAQRRKMPFKQILSKNQDINLISLARFFLFGGRDVWFVIGVPLYLGEVLHWGHVQIGSFMAAWVIAYGVVQAFAPMIIRKSSDGTSSESHAARLWGWVLSLVPVVMAYLLVGTVYMDDSSAQLFWSGATILIGLGAFGVVFAINSSVHSYLILAYSGRDNVAADVGFYYMANAAGRLLGTILSGYLYQTGGIVFCLIGSAILIALSSFTSGILSKHGKRTHIV